MDEIISMVEYIILKNNQNENKTIVINLFLLTNVVQSGTE